MTPFLRLITWSEIGPALIAASDRGYNVLVGSTPAKPLLFNNYDRHPNILNPAMHSTAAGAYQILYRWWVPYQKQLNLPDFSPASQDVYAMQQLRERGALPLIARGDIAGAIHAVSNIWASFPGAGYGQHEHTLAALLDAYKALAS